MRKYYSTNKALLDLNIPHNKAATILSDLVTGHVSCIVGITNHDLSCFLAGG